MTARLPLSILSDPSFLRALQKEQQRRKLKSLHEFIKAAWQQVEPGTPYVDGWHIEVICDHLEACRDREIRNLIINMPPRHMKSILVSVMFPCWVWTLSPHEQWLFSSYANSLSTRDSVKCRRLIQSDWYQGLFSDVFHLSGDQNAKTFFENNHYGYRMATSVGGSTTGFGGSFLVIDDPLNSKEAQSDAIRESCLEWWDQAMSTRLNDPKTGVRIVVMQRLHELDLSGHLLKQRDWELLCLPAEYEGESRTKTSLGWSDPRSAVGSLLWPERFGAAEIETLKSALGEYGTAGQLQQRPAPAGGGILKTVHLQIWPATRPLPVFDFILQSYDTAFTEKTTSDPSACTVFGVFTHEGKKGALILDSWAEALSYPQLRKRVIEDWHAQYGGDDKGRKGRKADQLLVEEKGSGISLMQDLRLANIPAIGYNPGRADKIARAHLSAPLLEMDMIYVLESTKRPNEPISWVKPLIGQMQKFPNAENDDMVDTFTQGIIFIKDRGLLELQIADYDEPEYPELPKRGNPYAA